MSKELFVIIDSNAIFHRAYHALPRFETKKGELVNAVFGFSSILLKALKDFKPDYIAAAFDVAAPTFRDVEYEEYKATRVKAPDELYAQIPRIKEVLSVFNVPVYEQEGFEADDVIGTVARIVKEKTNNVDVLIVSGDLDTLQLVDKRVRVYTMKKGVADTIIYNTEAVNKRFGGLTPEQLPDYKGLRGDPSDNIPGVPGIGEKTAIILISKYKNLEKLYDVLDKGKVEGVGPKMAEALKENREQAFFSRMLATIREDVPIDFNLEATRWGGFGHDTVEALFRELNFNSLLRRLPSVRGFEEYDHTKGEAKGRLAQILQDIEETYGANILSDELYKLEKELAPIIVEMEERGIKIDKKILVRLEKKLSASLKTLKQKIYKKAGGEFNANSPKQLSEILFGKLGIDTKGLKKTRGGETSTAAGELEKLRGRHPIIELMLKQRELQKLLSTYITPLPKLADEAGRIHTTFNPLGTATGRLSSNNPNLQNIPMRGDFAREIRNAFVAETGKVFFACDYSQMELRIVAHLAHDKNMIEAFKRGEDIHTRTASLVFGVDIKDVTPDMRWRSKALNFGIIYGMGATAFAQSAEISRDEASKFIERYFSVFEGVDQYMKAVKEKAYQLGYVETMFGRKRFLPDLHSPNPMLRAMAERAAINRPVQGTAADIIKMAMVDVSRKLQGADLLLQIHDELLWEAGKKDAEKLAEEARRILEDVIELSVPLSVEKKIGPSWGSME